MSITGTITSAEPNPASRESERLLLRLNTRGVTADGEVATVLIHNLSATGLLIETPHQLPLGKRLLVELPEAGEVSASVVWQSDRLAGCRFDEPISQAALSAAQLRNPIQHGLDMDELAATAPFGERLRFYRQRRGLSRAALASRTGLSTPTLWAWESGKTQPRRKSLDVVATALDLSVDELLTGKSLGRGPAPLTDAPDPSIPTEAAAPSRARKLRPFKEEIASMFGVEPDRVHITIEL